jgi:hypothetical protein
MGNFDNTNRGTLGKNERRTKDTHPEYTGHIDVNGVGYWLSAWVKEGQGGKKFFSLALKPKEEQPAPAPKPAGGFEEMDDDIPF